MQVLYGDSSTFPTTIHKPTLVTKLYALPHLFSFISSGAGEGYVLNIFYKSIESELMKWFSFSTCGCLDF